MAYLLIPALLFVAAAWFVRWSWRTDFDCYELFGGLDHLRTIIPILATSGAGRPVLIITSPSRVASIKVEFQTGSAKLKIDLGKRPGKKKLRTLLDFFHSNGLEPSFVDVADGRKLNFFQISGAPEELRTFLENLSQLVLTTTREPKSYSFEIRAHHFDVRFIYARNMHPMPKEDPSEAKSPNAERSLQDLKDTRKGCLNDVVAIFLRPLPFVAAFYLYDLRIAAVVLLATIVIQTIMATWLKANWKKRGSRSSSLMLVTLVCLLVHIATGAKIYLQIIPTIACSLIALEATYSWLTDGEMVKGKSPEEFYSATEAHLLHGALILVLVVGVIVNENLRSDSGLTLWVWYFAYLRIELMLGYLIAAAPALVLQMRRHSKLRTGASPED